MTDLKPGWLREDAERANARIQELEGVARSEPSQMKVREPDYIHHDDPEAPRWIADTLVGRFVYGRDNTGQCYIQAPTGERDVEDLEAAQREATAEYVAAVLKHPVIKLLEGVSENVVGNVVDDPSTQPGEIRAYYGIEEDGDDIQLMVDWGDGVSKADANLVLDVLTREPYYPLSGTIDKSLIDDLAARGYDMNTLRFSVMKKPASGKETPAG